MVIQENNYNQTQAIGLTASLIAKMMPPARAVSSFLDRNQLIHPSTSLCFGTRPTHLT